MRAAYKLACELCGGGVTMPGTRQAAARHLASRVQLHAVVQSWVLLQRVEYAVQMFGGWQLNHGIVPGRQNYMHR